MASPRGLQNTSLYFALRASYAVQKRSRRFCRKGIRTPVAAVKGQCPRPLDDGDAELFPAFA